MRKQILKHNDADSECEDFERGSAMETSVKPLQQRGLKGWWEGDKDDIPSRIHTKGAGVEAGLNTEYVQESVELAPTEPKEQHHSEF